MDINIGEKKIQKPDNAVSGEKVTIGGEVYYKISHVDKMRPFLMSIVSDSDHWMFISSNGSLTAGRQNAENSLFPYYTDDKITDFAETTGSKTLMIIHKGDKNYLWEPLSDRYEGVYSLERNLYKGVYGDSVIFQEINHDLNFKFSYGWYHSEKYGFIKISWLENLSESPVMVSVLDGIQNLLPPGVGSALQSSRSNLVNAYKKNELIRESCIGVYSLSANIVDRPEPSESLKATLAWTTGLNDPKILLSSVQLDNFRNTGVVETEEDVRAEPGAFFINTQFEIPGFQEKDWYTCLDINKSVSDIHELADEIASGNIIDTINEEVLKSKLNLIHIINSSDGLQTSNDHLSCARHASNVLFNIMRGGILNDGYSVDREDLRSYFWNANRKVASDAGSFFDSIPEQIRIDTLQKEAEKTENNDIIRLCQEYLPLYFSRRHGDPSRPWNAFSIDTKDEDGNKVLNYEGNWRDIFQNWEALAVSFPSFVESMIAKFLNASTADGYNPYRITRSGIDWEVIEPDDPWSFIGYWGDHQIIYLLKLLEISNKFHPGRLEELYNQKIFSTANVPYRIKPFDDLVADPHDTIDFDHDCENKIHSKVGEIGSDGKLILSRDNSVRKSGMMEKLMVPLLAKLSNFVPEGGIWLNTQRPEWNDANNALVGYGVSMVTLSYIRRYIRFFQIILKDKQADNFDVSVEFDDWFKSIWEVFKTNKGLLEGKISDKERYEVLRELGLAAQFYNQRVYEEYSETDTDLACSDLLEFLELTLQYVDHTLRCNKRSDSMYHAYNLLHIEDENCRVDHLYEMLEGQVAILSSSYLSSGEALEVLDAMKGSKLFRPDQYSYLLYPDRQLPKFVDRNNIPSELVEKSVLLKKMLDTGDQSIIEKDIHGNYHFNSSFCNADDLEAELNSLAPEHQDLAKSEKDVLLGIFENVFRHREFTGRSGTFYGFEGLNSIYWHMVSKLLLAVQENIYWAVDRMEDRRIIDQLIEHYFEIRAGIGLSKSPDLYGAFPTDPYSHTPGHKGAQQPGMTGQVKEDILSRLGELGILVDHGKIRFREDMLRMSEFLKEDDTFYTVSNTDEVSEMELSVGSLAFTLCQIPVIYHADTQEKITVLVGEESVELAGLELNQELSQRIFNRDPEIREIHVYLNPHLN